MSFGTWRFESSHPHAARAAGRRPSQLLGGLWRVAVGEAPLSPTITQTQGKSDSEIATALYMSVSTGKAHVSRLVGKLCLDNRVQVALLAHDAGLA